MLASGRARPHRLRLHTPHFLNRGRCPIRLVAWTHVLRPAQPIRHSHTDFHSTGHAISEGAHIIVGYFLHVLHRYYTGITWRHSLLTCAGRAWRRRRESFPRTCTSFSRWLRRLAISQTLEDRVLQPLAILLTSSTAR